MGESRYKTKRPDLRFTESEIKLLLTVIKDLEKPLELMYYFLEKDTRKSFVLILISAKEVDLDVLLKGEKRDTDILFSVDREESLFALICQETKVDGAYRFAQRILSMLLQEGAKEIYCTEIEVSTTTYDLKDLIMKSVEKYFLAKKEKRENEIIFYTV